MASIAVVGAGISGLSAAYYLQKSGHQVTLFEANDYFGGHSRTVDVTLDGVTAGVDTGFLVCNDRTYPNLLRFFAELNVDLAASDMSFAVRSDRDQVEWSGTRLSALFAQKSNLVRPKFLRFLLDIVRFNRTTTAMVKSGDVPSMSLADFLAREGYGQALFDWYLWPMVGSIWSSPRGEVMDFDLAMLLRFCHNHGLLQVANRPQWMTVRGGSRNYVSRVIAALKDARLNARVEKIITTPGFVEVKLANQLAAPERFDYAIMATHSDQSKQILSTTSPRISEALNAIAYQPNRCIVHTDAALMPKRRAAWASWNYVETAAINDRRPVALTYWLNNLQPLPFSTPLFETLNPPVEPAKEHIIAEFEYWHPLLNQAAISAQKVVRELQGTNRTYFAGAWLYNGFHEDGIRSALECVQAINTRDSARPVELAAE
ncbi:MAG: FAD-dependent oxidoreductase [Burkholderiales bacterium]|nr:MAG: FAD-dependent oxidoreductase [Betaproteobacteria bacterium]TAG83491.1 MAG: FAD-dependent oxidoreductase [Burkholderiales bacterium]